MRRILASALPPTVLLLAFFAPLGGIGPWWRSALVLASFALAGALAAGPRAMRDAALVAWPGIVLGLLLTLFGAMEPMHLVYSIAMAGAALLLCVGAAWSITALRRQPG